MNYIPGCYYAATLLGESTIKGIYGLIPTTASNDDNVRYLHRFKDHIDKKILVRHQEGNIFKFNNAFVLEEWLDDIERIHITSGDLDG